MKFRKDIWCTNKEESITNASLSVTLQQPRLMNITVVLK